MNLCTIYVELDGLEFEVEFEYLYNYSPAKLSGPWEDSYPEEESFDYNILTTDEGMNAVESYELMELREDGGDVFFGAAMADMMFREESRETSMWDNERDRLVDESL